MIRSSQIVNGQYKDYLVGQLTRFYDLVMTSYGGEYDGKALFKGGSRWSLKMKSGDSNTSKPSRHHSHL